MPSCAAVFEWLNARPKFVEQYTRAREAQADMYADQIVDIADDAGMDVETVVLGNGKKEQRLNGEAVARAKVRIDARKWVASKLKPKKYGDRVTHQGDEEAPPIQLEHTELSTTQRAARLSSFLALANRQKGASA
jgi:hypothetical protein